MPAVPAGRVTVRASRVGYRAAESAGTVQTGGRLTLNFTLAATGRRDQAANQPSSRELRDEKAAAKSQVAPLAEADMLMRAASPAAGASGGVTAGAEPWRWQREPGNTEAYNAINENRFLTALTTPVSTFSIDVDAASYSNVRRFLSQGTLPPGTRSGSRSWSTTSPIATPTAPAATRSRSRPRSARAPGRRTTGSSRIGLQARRVPTRDLPPSNLVFLIDVSGSMQSPDKLPLVKQAFRALGEGAPAARTGWRSSSTPARPGLVLPPTSGSDQTTILEAIDRLEAGGSTAGGAGIRLAYDVAREHFNREGNNRVILATDGDFNVGVSSDAEMVRLIEQRREEGIFLTVLGFGMGNLKDAKMEQLADKGNGHYAYIDTFREAQKVFVQEFGGTLFTVAKDVKIQVEFNPARVRSYRLIGYENRLLNREDFADDKKDAGELGAGHSVTALYEIVPVGAKPVATADDSLTYQQVSVRPEARRSDELLTVRVRYKDPQGTVSRLLETPVKERSGGQATEDMRFASAVAGFALLLRDSEHRGGASFEQVLALARGARGEDENGYRAEFIGMVETARTLKGGAQQRGE